VKAYLKNIQWIACSFEMKLKIAKFIRWVADFWLELVVVVKVPAFESATHLENRDTEAEYFDTKSILRSNSLALLDDQDGSGRFQLSTSWRSVLLYALTSPLSADCAMVAPLEPSPILHQYLKSFRPEHSALLLIGHNFHQCLLSA